MRRLIAGMKIRQKIFFSFMLLISFCLLTTLYMTSIRVSDVIRDKTINYSRQLVSQTMQNIEYYLLDTRYLGQKYRARRAGDSKGARVIGAKSGS
jgi:hypothetical protein